MNVRSLLEQITVSPKIFGGKPIVRGRRLALAPVLNMLAAGDSAERALQRYRWLEKEEVNACLVFARRVEGTNALELDRETNTRTGK
ncbi:MAG: DUF433 domain-containing protein [Candidatus Binatia bacterium]